MVCLHGREVVGARLAAQLLGLRLHHVSPTKKKSVSSSLSPTEEVAGSGGGFQGNRVLPSRLTPPPGHGPHPFPAGIMAEGHCQGQAGGPSVPRPDPQPCSDLCPPLLSSSFPCFLPLRCFLLPTPQPGLELSCSVSVCTLV